MAYGNWHGAMWRNVWANAVYSIDVLWDFCQDIEANKTKIAMNAIRVKKNNSAYSFYNAYGKAGLGDFSGNKFESTVSMDLRNASSQTFDLTDRHSVCTHNADGSWPNGTYCGWWEFKSGVNAYNSPEVGWTYFNVDGSIPKIPRATVPTLSANSVNMGSAVTINLPKATSSFTHDIFYKYSSDSSYTTLASGVTGTSQSWTPPVSLASKIPNASSGVWNILVRTKSGSTIIGDKIINVTLNVPSTIVPSISSVAVAEATTGIAAQFAAYIQGRSTFKVTVAAAGNQGSTIKSYSVKADGKTYSGNSNVFTTQVINGSGSISVVATVTDSRGRTASKTVSVAVTAYSSPSIPTFKAVRCTSAGVEDEDGTAVKISFNFSIAAMGNKNKRSFKIQQLNGNTWTDIHTITDAYSQNSSVIKTGPFSVDSKFSFRAVAADFFTSATVYSDIAPSFALINFGASGKSIALGMVSGNQPKTIQNALTQVPSLRTSGSGSSGYMKILQVKTKAQAWNYNCVEFEFYVGGKAKPFTKGSVTVIGDSSTDPNVGYIRTSDPDVPIYVVKANTNTWDIYVNKVESEQIGFMNVHVYRPDAVTASVQNQWVSTLPSGYSKSAWEHLDACYPVNSVKITTDAVNPGTKIGGTWVQFAQGRTLIGQGTGSDGTTTKTFAVNEQGGSYNHRHDYKILYREFYGSVNTPFGEQLNSDGSYSWQTPEKQSSTATANHLSGSGTASRINQSILKGITRTQSDSPVPYQVVYFWKRTA